ncbi:class I SAM-dependent methyltransferase [Thiocystis violascens]|uniref:Methyltransferase family protein n=1 Tax=Thiocystis violascens (strain ATCC 17096 / DSM 198 / 6111) TaxID=765911 RepID=I3Y7A2_THIV6|nr:class I SAM-dependent methyltransferase [Thiocystis violascens]AFL72870.1 methyltransferase family protein [Thiocystis violascens DSM 198]
MTANPDPTRQFYEVNAETFVTETRAIDMHSLYAPFLARIPADGHILDAGCGSGRDSRAFLDLGFRVTAFDASPRMVHLASLELGQSVHCLSFQALDWRCEFDAIWACASLLHVKMTELPDVLRRMARALRAGGVLYASFKYGQGERFHHGRHFSDFNAASLKSLLHDTGVLAPIEIWITHDRRPGRSDEQWLNVLLSPGVLSHQD